MSENLRIAIAGIHGRMGSAIAACIGATRDLELVAAVAPALAGSASDARRRTFGLSKLVTVQDAAAAAQVLIDFTVPIASVAHAEAAADCGFPIVIGTTGFAPEQRERLARAAERTPIVLAPNMSVGVHEMVRAAKALAAHLGASVDIEILDTHHRGKRDAPSGTALWLAGEIAAAQGHSQEQIRSTRSGLTGERGPSEIGIQSLRGGDVVGEHTVYYFGDGERIELVHRATNRNHFARGALRAARWLIAQKPGLYSMDDVLR